MGGALAGLAVAWAATWAVPEVYTSRAVLRAVASPIPERFVQGAPQLTAEALRRSMLPVIFSRSVLTTLIQTHDLYRAERSRMPMEDVIGLMQQHVEIRATGTEAVSVAFSYRDPRLAQRITRDIMTRVVDETLRQPYYASLTTVSFLRGQADRAAAAWEDLNAKVRAAGPRAERLVLDRNLAIRQYETLRQQVADAETIANLEERRQGPTLEVLDLPSLPERPSISHAAILAAGGIGGMLVGALVGSWRRLRLGAPPLPAAALH